MNKKCVKLFSILLLVSHQTTLPMAQHLGKLVIAGTAATYTALPHIIDTQETPKDFFDEKEQSESVARWYLRNVDKKCEKHSQAMIATTNNSVSFRFNSEQSTTSVGYDNPTIKRLIETDPEMGQELTGIFSRFGHHAGRLNLSPSLHILFGPLHKTGNTPGLNTSLTEFGMSSSKFYLEVRQSTVTVGITPEFLTTERGRAMIEASLAHELGHLRNNNHAIDKLTSDLIAPHLENFSHDKKIFKKEKKAYKHNTEFRADIVSAALNPQSHPQGLIDSFKCEIPLQIIESTGYLAFAGICSALTLINLKQFGIARKIFPLILGSGTILVAQRRWHKNTDGYPSLARREKFLNQFTEDTNNEK